VIAPCVIEKISQGETYFRGLAEFHGTPLHGIVNMHILFDYFILVYGSLAVVTTNLGMSKLFSKHKIYYYPPVNLMFLSYHVRLMCVSSLRVV